MTIREALDEKRAERKNDIKSLVLCKHELFYLPERGHSPKDTVYPVSWNQAQKEAGFFGVPLSHE